MSASNNDHRDRFVQALTRAQGQLRTYITTLMPNAQNVDDVLQHTNMTLWKKADEFDFASKFTTWAYRVAYFEVLAYLRDARRSRLCFPQGLMEKIVDESNKQLEEYDDRLDALRSCLADMPTKYRNLIHQRYTESKSVAEIASVQKVTPNAISRAMYRIRRALLQCIENRLGKIMPAGQS